MTSKERQLSLQSGHDIAFLTFASEKGDHNVGKATSNLILRDSSFCLLAHILLTVKTSRCVIILSAGREPNRRLEEGERPNNARPMLLARTTQLQQQEPPPWELVWKPSHKHHTLASRPFYKQQSPPHGLCAGGHLLKLTRDPSGGHVWQTNTCLVVCRRFFSVRSAWHGLWCVGWFTGWKNGDMDAWPLD